LLQSSETKRLWKKKLLRGGESCAKGGSELSGRGILESVGRREESRLGRQKRNPRLQASFEKKGTIPIGKKERHSRKDISPLPDGAD